MPDEKPQFLPSRKFLIVFFSGICISILFLGSPPKEFPTNTFFEVKTGESLQGIARTLEEQKFISSPSIFQLGIILFGGQRGANAGEYIFSHKTHAFGVAWRIASGNHGIGRTKVTIPEGTRVSEMKEIFKEYLPAFDETAFVTRAQEYEGYLFPDTYFFFDNANEEDVLRVMRDTFNEKIKMYEEEIKKSGRTLEEIVTMASILEKEARGEEQYMVSGILWKRLSIEMPLQVDATFLFINGKGTADLTLDDLKLDSPYNTYVYKGLPPGPIGSPGTDAIEAALRPKSSPYLFYLSDKEGNMHYARTFEEHKRNKAQYLR